MTLQAELEQLVRKYHLYMKQCELAGSGEYPTTVNSAILNANELDENIAKAILATVSKHLPEKVKDRTGEIPEGKTYHTKNGYWITAEDYGRNTAITEMEGKLGGNV